MFTGTCQMAAIHAGPVKLEELERRKRPRRARLARRARDKIPACSTVAALPCALYKMICAVQAVAGSRHARRRRSRCKQRTTRDAEAPQCRGTPDQMARQGRRAIFESRRSTELSLFGGFISMRTPVCMPGPCLHNISLNASC